MTPLRILYIGIEHGTCLQRADALRRLGHLVHMLDPYRFTGKSKIMSKWIYETGALGLERYVLRQVLAAIPPISFEVVWVDNGALVGPDLVRELVRRYGTVINYNLDDPFGPRETQFWRLYLRSVAEYSLIVVVRKENEMEARAAGAKRVLRVWRSADEVAHAARKLSADDWKRWSSEVVFVGTWMRERGPFMAELVRREVPLAIYGDNWPKAREWPTLRPFWRGPGLYDADDYSKAIQCSKVCLGLLSVGNRDLHTQRSLEVPYLGGAFCAERTSEHCQLYEENEEAVFWSSVEECSAACHRLLSYPELRSAIAANGRKRCVQNRTTNEYTLSAILDHALTDSEVLAHIDPSGERLSTNFRAER